jgi:hypothetical protein
MVLSVSKKMCNRGQRRNDSIEENARLIFFWMDNVRDTFNDAIVDAQDERSRFTVNTRCTSNILTWAFSNRARSVQPTCYQRWKLYEGE